MRPPKFPGLWLQDGGYTTIEWLAKIRQVPVHTRHILLANVAATVLLLCLTTTALAHEGHETTQETSLFSPLVIISTGIAIAGVGYVMFRIFKGGADPTE